MEPNTVPPPSPPLRVTISRPLRVSSSWLSGGSALLTTSCHVATSVGSVSFDILTDIQPRLEKAQPRHRLNADAQLKATALCAHSEVAHFCIGRPNREVHSASPSNVKIGGLRESAFVCRTGFRTRFSMLLCLRLIGQPISGVYQQAQSISSGLQRYYCCQAADNPSLPHLWIAPRQTEYVRSLLLNSLASKPNSRANTSLCLYPPPECPSCTLFLKTPKMEAFSSAGPFPCRPWNVLLPSVTVHRKGREGRRGPALICYDGLAPRRSGTWRVSRVRKRTKMSHLRGCIQLRASAIQYVAVVPHRHFRYPPYSYYVPHFGWANSRGGWEGEGGCTYV